MDPGLKINRKTLANGGVAQKVEGVDHNCLYGRFSLLYVISLECGGLIGSRIGMISHRRVYRW